MQTAMLKQWDIGYFSSKQNGGAGVFLYMSKYTTIWTPIRQLDT